MAFEFRFTGRLEKYENNLWNYHIKVPPLIVDEIKKLNATRFLVSLGNGKAFHASLMPAGEDVYFIKINQELRQKHSLRVSSEIQVLITQDDSRYGIPISEEMEELLLQDPEGDMYFHKLTPGKQRSLLYLVNKVKSPALRIKKSLIIIEHLKEVQGQLDFRRLNEDFKNKKDLF